MWYHIGTKQEDMMSHRIGVRFRDDINDALRAATRKHDRSINWIVQTAVVEWLDRKSTRLNSSH